MTIATKTNPKLWEKAKREVCRKNKSLCKHSARKMQAATRWYKAHGGKYKGPKSKSNSLARWGKQKWRTSSGKKSGGKRRYLPDKAWRNLSKSEIRRTNAAKRAGYSRGRQYVRQPRDIARKTKKYRTSRSTKSARSKKRRTKKRRTKKRRTKKRHTKRTTRKTSKRRSTKRSKGARRTKTRKRSRKRTKKTSKSRKR